MHKVASLVYLPAKGAAGSSSALGVIFLDADEDFFLSLNISSGDFSGSGSGSGGSSFFSFFLISSLKGFGSGFFSGSGVGSLAVYVESKVEV